MYMHNNIAFFSSYLFKQSRKTTISCKSHLQAIFCYYSWVRQTKLLNYIKNNLDK